MLRDKCPDCGKGLRVVSFEAECSIPLSPDGFSILDTSYLSTSNETVVCECGFSCGLRDLEGADDLL